MIALVASVAVVASILILANDFTNDDIHVIVNNVRVQELSRWREWFTEAYWPPPFSPDLYRPLTLALLAGEYAFGAGQPEAFRLLSVVLYVIGAVAAFRLARRVVPDPYALAAGVLFAAHPVHVEAVALGVGQAELAVGLFAMIIVERYIHWRREATLTPRHLVVLVILYAAACLFKEQALTIPALMIAAEIWVLPRPSVRETRPLLIALAAAAGVALVIMLARRAVLGDLAGTFTAEALVGLGYRGRLLTMLGVVPEWLRLFLWPAHLRGDYSPQEITAAVAIGLRQTLGIVLIAAFVGGWIWSHLRAPVLAFALAWIAVGLFPVSNVLVPTGIILAERTLYLPSFGVVLALVETTRLLATKLTVTVPRTSAIPGYACAVLVVLGTGRSLERDRVWRNEGYFIARGVQDAPRSFRMQQEYGDLLYGVGRTDLAREAYQRAMQYSPPAVVWRVRNALAKTLDAQGDFAGEIEQLEASIAQHPTQELARARLVSALLAAGRYSDAIAASDSAMYRGINRPMFERLRFTADSAQQARAPAGTVRLRLEAGNFRAERGL
jgi:hypothetical protein